MSVPTEFVGSIPTRGSFLNGISLVRGALRRLTGRTRVLFRTA
jgi:hypothetical protein